MVIQKFLNAGRSIALCSAMLALLAGCGGSDSASKTSSTTTTQTDSKLLASQTAVNQIEAESADNYSGAAVGDGGVGSFDNGDWLSYTSTNFGAGVTGFDAWVAVDPAYAGQAIEIRVDSPTGTKHGELTVQSTGGWENFVKQSVQLTTPISGTHDLYLVARGTYGAANFDKFQFTNTSSTSVVSHTGAISVKHSGKCLNIVDGSTANGAKTNQSACDSRVGESWTLRHISNGEYQIVADHSGKCLDVPSGATTDGVALQQWDCAPGAKQLWRLQTEPDGYYRVISVASNKCLDVAGISLNEGQQVQQWTCLDQDNQRWKFVESPSNPDEFYKGPVSVKHSQKCLDVIGGSTANGAQTD